VRILSVPAVLGPRPFARAIAAALVGLLVSAAPARLHAQALTNIGATVAGTPVMLESKSVTRNGTVVTATVRVKLAPPLKSPQGDLISSRTTAMYDCAKQTVATKESWYFLDEAGRKEAMHKVVKMPGFGPAFKGSLADVAMKHLCAAPTAGSAKK
jgi:hypothetical protein